MTEPPQDITGHPAFAALLGADGVSGLRSGVGRVTFEVARVLTRAPDIADLALLVGQTVRPGTFLDLPAVANPTSGQHDRSPIRALRQVARGVLPPSAGTQLRAAVRAVPGLLALRARYERRRLDHVAADMARRTGRPVVYHELNMIARPFSGPTVVTVNDLSWLAHPTLHPAERVAWISRGMPRTLRQATRFIAISNFTAQEMVRLLGIDRARIDVVHPGVSHHFQPRDVAAAAPTLARYGLRDHGYVLAVSTLEPRKNFDRLLAAHGRLPPAMRQAIPLVIVGGPGWGTTLADAASARAQCEGRLRLLGHVPDDELVALYARCAVAIYPSLYEGFGLPVLEPMACAAPVVTSNTTALPDTAGDAAVLVDPLDVDAIAEALRHVLDDPAFADKLRAGGPAQAARFTWERMAAGMIASWRTALAA
jgi:glycosyltransferase involved in cell wall biosynthesis